MIGGADLEGAFVGGFTGIAGGPQGIVGGAILGGAAGSTVSSAKLAYQAWRCYWNNT